MKVKDVIISALNILGRSGLAASLADGDELTAEERETVDTLLYCFNATEDEVARNYMPLFAREELSSPDGEYFYASFINPPVKIKRVTAAGAAAEYELFPQYMAVNAKKITVEYEYAPSKKRLEGSSDFGGEVGEYLLALGAASEYCLINGEIEEAELWENKYRREIDRAQRKLPSCGSVPPRRWV